MQDCLGTIQHFDLVTRRMKTLLQRFVKIIQDAEARFELSQTRLKDLNKLLYEYENLSLEAYAPSLNKRDLLLFENPDNIEVKTEFDLVLAAVVNPFTGLKLWLQYEILEIEALQECFQRRKQIQQSYKSTVERVQSALNELQRLQRGQFTFSSLLKNKEQVERTVQQMTEEAPKWGASIINARLHFQIVNVNMTKQVIPYFKLQKFTKYFENVTAFAGRELLNSKKLLSLFEQIGALNTGLITLNETHWKIRDMQQDSRVVAFREETLQLE